jgi:hypothetical protein
MEGCEVSGEIGLGLFLNMLFWAAVIIAAVAVTAYAAAYWFPGSVRKIRKGRRAGSRRAGSPHPREAAEASAERWRKVS